MSTLKQKKAIVNVVENRGNVSKAMKDAGYADATAKNPKNLTDSKAWEEIMDEYWPDNKLAEVGKEGLEATRTISAMTGTKANGGTVDFVDVPDFDARHKFFATITKLKDKIPVTKTDVTSKGEKISSIFADKEVLSDLSDNNSDKETS